MKVLILSVALLAGVSSAATTIPEPVKRCIYEITSPGAGQGTGFTVMDSTLGFVLVTCKHVVQDKNKDYVDSIFLRRNKLLPTGQAISDTSQFVVRLKVDGRLWLTEHRNPAVDLIMIPIGIANTTMSSGESPYGFHSRAVLSKDELEEKGITEGIDVELIGFSLSLPDNEPHYHFSRFGKIGLYTTEEFTLLINKKPRTANYILLDMSTRPGDSGSPIVAHISGRPYLIGFLSATSTAKEYGVAYPVYYLYDLMERMRDNLRAVMKRDQK